MSACDYCGRENRTDAVFCDACGTDLRVSQRAKPVLRPMNVRQRKEGWRAVVVAAICVAAAALLAWKAHHRWDFLGGCIVAFGLAYVIEVMRENKASRMQPENGHEKEC